MSTQQQSKEVTEAWNGALKATIEPMLEKWVTGGASFAPSESHTQAEVALQNQAALMLQMIAQELLDLRELCQELSGEIHELAIELEGWKNGDKVHEHHLREAQNLLEELEEWRDGIRFRNPSDQPTPSYLKQDTAHADTQDTCDY